MRWCNATGDSTLHPVMICMNIQEDIQQGKNLWGWNSWTYSLEYSKMRSEPSECMWKTTGAFINSWRIKIAMESDFGKYAQEVWERSMMDPDMHTMLLDTKLLKTTLLNMYTPILMETILKALREQSKKDDQMSTAGEIIGSVPETSLDLDPILEERGGFWEGQRWIFSWRSGVDREPALVQRLVAWSPSPPSLPPLPPSPSCRRNPRRDRWNRNKCDFVRLRNRKRLMENIQNVFMRLFQCKTQRSCTDVLYRRVCGFDKQGACLNHDVGEFVKRGETLRHRQSILPRNNGEIHLHLTFAEDRLKHDPSVKSMCGSQDASHIWQLGGANCIGGINVFVSSKDECFKYGEQTQCRIVLQSQSKCETGNAGWFWVFVGWWIQTHR